MWAVSLALRTILGREKRERTVVIDPSANGPTWLFLVLSWRRFRPDGNPIVFALGTPATMQEFDSSDGRRADDYLAVATFAEYFEQLKIMRRDAFTEWIHYCFGNLDGFNVSTR